MGAAESPARSPELLKTVLARRRPRLPEPGFSVELGVTTVDHYFDTGIGRHQAGRTPRQRRPDGASSTSVTRRVAMGSCGHCRSRSRSRHGRACSIPKWHEGMLAHGYEGVRQIRGSMLRNTMGWSATTGEVAPWGLSADSPMTFTGPSIQRCARRGFAALTPWPRPNGGTASLRGS